MYSTAKDVLEIRKEEIRQQIEKEALKLATNSINKADDQLKAQRQAKAAEIRKNAEMILQEYKADLSNELYDKTRAASRNAKIDTSEVIDAQPKVRKITGVK